MLKELGQIAVFIICAQTLLHFRAKESYEKYIKLLISMMVLLFLLKPFFGGICEVEDELVTKLVTEYEQRLNSQALGDLGQAEVEAVVMNMASEMIAQEEQQETAMSQEAKGTEGVEEKKGASDCILVETIQIGE